eukprot:jgi/Chrpa1/13794/Chrysochromulina_OHIO_Genome00002663-RA
MYTCSYGVRGALHLAPISWEPLMLISCLGDASTFFSKMSWNPMLRAARGAQMYTSSGPAANAP